MSCEGNAIRFSFLGRRVEGGGKFSKAISLRLSAKAWSSAIEGSLEDVAGVEADAERPESVAGRPTSAVSLLDCASRVDNVGLFSDRWKNGCMLSEERRMIQTRYATEHER